MVTIHAIVIVAAIGLIVGDALAAILYDPLPSPDSSACEYSATLDSRSSDLVQLAIVGRSRHFPSCGRGRHDHPSAFAKTEPRSPHRFQVPFHDHLVTILEEFSFLTRG
jgi:hypothetical protein